MKLHPAAFADISCLGGGGGGGGGGQHLQLSENGPRPVLIHRKLTVSETIPTEFCLNLWESK